MRRILSDLFAAIPLVFLSIINIWDIQFPNEAMSLVCFLCGTISIFLYSLSERIENLEACKVQIDDSKETEAIAKEFMKLANCPLSQEETKTILNCVNCGAPIKFNYCEYCGTVYKWDENL